MMQFALCCFASGVLPALVAKTADRGGGVKMPALSPDRGFSLDFTLHMYQSTNTQIFFSVINKSCHTQCVWQMCRTCHCADVVPL